MLKKSSFEVDMNFHIHIIPTTTVPRHGFPHGCCITNHNKHNPQLNTTSSYGKTYDSIAQFKWKSMDVCRSQCVSKNYIIMIIHLYKLVRDGHKYSMNKIIHQWRTKKESVDKYTLCIYTQYLCLISCQ